MGNISNVGEVADLLAAYLDEEAWIEFRAALLEALHDKVPPSADAIFRPKTTWARALTAFLGSRHVQPRSQALMMCQYVGLEQLPGMWRTAQALRRSQQSQQSHGVATWILNHAFLLPCFLCHVYLYRHASASDSLL